jgi:signal transduction histidine kinase
MDIVNREGRYIPVIMNSTAIDLAGEQYVMSILHDIAEIRMTQEALKLANRKLNLLAEITRHDIRNKLTVLGGYLELIRQPPREPEYSMYIRKIQDLVGIVSENIEFTKLYQNLGEVAPDWQNVHDAFFHACARVDIRRICVQSDTGGLEIFADPLLERAFYNLVENVVLHGGNVTMIRISAFDAGDGATIVVEDDGAGIPPSDKEKIFTKGYGKNTGLGLFLVREILSITGIGIRETGDYRKGARFELHVPREACRYPEKQSGERCHIRISGQNTAGVRD